MRDGQLHLLLVDDDEIDREVVVRCLRQHRHHFTVTATADASEALHILCGEAGHRRLPRPYAIVLELYLPGMNGFAFLQGLRQDPDLKTSTVFVLTGSASEQDRVRAAAYPIAGYWLKDELDAQCTPLIQRLEAYRAQVR
jgi:CheY-like chemotaxis protein